MIWYFGAGIEIGKWRNVYKDGRIKETENSEKMEESKWKAEGMPLLEADWQAQF